MVKIKRAEEIPLPTISLEICNALIAFYKVSIFIAQEKHDILWAACECDREDIIEDLLKDDEIDRNKNEIDELKIDFVDDVCETTNNVQVVLSKLTPKQINDIIEK